MPSDLVRESTVFPDKIKIDRSGWSVASEKFVRKFDVSNNGITGFLDTLDGVTETPVSTPAEDDLLLPTPLAGVLVGYGCVSTRDQNLARQPHLSRPAARSASSTKPAARTPTGQS